jgi:hypothetical protein
LLEAAFAGFAYSALFASPAPFSGCFRLNGL